MSTPKEILALCAISHKNKKKLVFATGVFDVLHSEHSHFLTKAKQAGDILIIGIESDTRVKKIKGHARPVTTQDMRVQNLKDLDIADAVFILPELFSSFSEHLDLLKEIQPDYLAVSSHTLHLDKKRILMSKVSGELLVVHEHNPAISTTKILTV